MKKDFFYSIKKPISLFGMKLNIPFSTMIFYSRQYY